MSGRVAAGTDLLPWTHRVTIDQTRAWSELLHDPNPIHVDPDAVARLGLGARPINQGPANVAFLVNMLSANFPEGDLAGLDVRFAGNVYVGDTVEVSGQVVDVASVPAGQVVRCRLELRATDGAVAATAEAHVRLRGGDS